MVNRFMLPRINGVMEAFSEPITRFTEKIHAALGSSLLQIGERKLPLVRGGLDVMD